MRRVVVSRRDRENAYQLKEVGEAMFHQFGVDYTEFESGAGNFSTAIIEWPDGRIESVPIDFVRFVTPSKFTKQEDLNHDE